MGPTPGLWRYFERDRRKGEVMAGAKVSPSQDTTHTSLPQGLRYPIMSHLHACS